MLGDALEVLKQMEDGSVDVVISGFCLHNLQSEHRAAIVAEIYRVLVPGGMFTQCDKVALNEQKAHIESLTTQLVMFDGFADDPEYRESWINHYIVDDQHGIRISEQEWTDLCIEVGFVAPIFSSRTLMDCEMTVVKS